MNRVYNVGAADDVLFFKGYEVEHTPAFDLRTLFVVGPHDPPDVTAKLDSSIRHIYFGANQSFNPISDEEWLDWDSMVMHFLKEGYKVTLDFDVKYAEKILDSGFSEYHNFIPMISVKIPYINQHGYNAVVKIDDKGFKASNPGVWCHYLHDLQDRSKLTPWAEYTKDEIVK